MPLRIGFDLDGVLAAMESELVRQAEILFGEQMTRRLREPAAPIEVDGAAVAQQPTEPPADPQPAVPDSVPPLLQLNMTARQQRRLWRHVESIENFWESLTEIEPGSVQRLAAIATDRRWEVIFLTKRPGTGPAPCTTSWGTCAGALRWPRRSRKR